MSGRSRFLQDFDPETRLWRKIDPDTGSVVSVRPAMWKSIRFTDAYCGHLMRDLPKRIAELERGGYVVVEAGARG